MKLLLMITKSEVVWDAHESDILSPGATLLEDPRNVAEAENNRTIQTHRIFLASCGMSPGGIRSPGTVSLSGREEAATSADPEAWGRS